MTDRWSRAPELTAQLADSLDEFRSYPLEPIERHSFEHPESATRAAPPMLVSDADDDADALLGGFRAGTLDPVEVVEESLARLQAPAADRAVVLTPDDARAAALESARRWAAGEARPLEGVPFCAKDNLAVAGTITTAGTRRLAAWRPTATATAVQRLLDAGAILVGKTALSEWAFGDALDEHSPRNPWAPDHWTGGSSSGSAVALATASVPLAVGTDTGGSIRVPSSYCGVTGLKPSGGAIPGDGVVPVSSTLDRVGPMARTARDAALMFAVMSGSDESPAAGPIGGPHPLAGLRVGIVDGWGPDGCDAAVLAARDRVANALVEFGAAADHLELPEPHLATTAAWMITVCEFASLHADAESSGYEYTDSSIDRILTGRALTATDYLRALRIRAELRRRTLVAMAGVDVLLTPGTPTPAPRMVPAPDPMFHAGEPVWMEGISRNFIGFNLLDFPAVVVPSGFADDPMRPLSVQFVTRPGDERIALATAAAWQAVSDVHRATPPDVPRPIGPASSRLRAE